MRMIVLAALITIITGCANIEPLHRYHAGWNPPWDPDPRKGENLLNQRRPQCAGQC